MAYDKEYMREYHKAWRESHRAHLKASHKVWREANREHCKEYRNDYMREYRKVDINAIGQRKDRIRHKSLYYLSKYGKKIEGYQIHHCCTYTEPYKFIYCSKEMHRLIHSYLRQHNIDADSNHYEYIKHLLDDTIVKYNIE